LIVRVAHEVNCTASLVPSWDRLSVPSCPAVLL